MTVSALLGNSEKSRDKYLTLLSTPTVERDEFSMWGRARARVHASADSPNSSDGNERPALISEEEEATSSSLSVHVVPETSAAGSASSLPLHQQPEPHTPPRPSLLSSPVPNGQRKLSIMSSSQNDMSVAGVIMQLQAEKRAHDFAKNWHSKWMERRSGIKPGGLDRLVLTGWAWGVETGLEFQFMHGGDKSAKLKLFGAGWNRNGKFNITGDMSKSKSARHFNLNVMNAHGEFELELAEQPDQSPPYFEGKCETCTLKGGMKLFSEDVWFKELSPDDWWEKYDNRIALAESEEEEGSKNAKRIFDMTFGVWSHPRSGRRYSEKSGHPWYDRPASLGEDEDTSQVNMLDDKTSEALVPVTYVKMAEVFNIEREKKLNDLHYEAGGDDYDMEEALNKLAQAAGVQLKYAVMALTDSVSSDLGDSEMKIWFEAMNAMEVAAQRFEPRHKDQLSGDFDQIFAEHVKNNPSINKNAAEELFECIHNAIIERKGEDGRFEEWRERVKEAEEALDAYLTELLPASATDKVSLLLLKPWIQTEQAQSVNMGGQLSGGHRGLSEKQKKVSTWQLSSPLHKWRWGVHTFNSRVVELCLSSSGISMELSHFCRILTRCSELTLLSVADNPQLRGDCQSFGALLNIKYLNASNCASICGPLAGIADLKLCEQLNLRNCAVSGSEGLKPIQDWKHIRMVNVCGLTNLCGPIPTKMSSKCEYLGSNLENEITAKPSMVVFRYPFSIISTENLLDPEFKFIDHETAVERSIVFQEQKEIKPFHLWAFKGKNDITIKVRREEIGYISHRWLGEGPFPDDNNQTKLKQLQHLACNLPEEMRDVKYWWIDYMSTPQEGGKGGLAKHIMGVLSLPRYIKSCAWLVVLCDEESSNPRYKFGGDQGWSMGGWCRVERLAALVPYSYDDAPIITKTMKVNGHLQSQSVEVLDDDAVPLPPIEGEFLNGEKDRKRCSDIYQMLKSINDDEQIEWNVFLSHYQEKGSDQCGILSRDLKQRGFKVWFDQEAVNLNEEGMKDGVSRSAFFVLFLNVGTLTREWVQSECKWALESSKTVILVHESDPRHGAPLDELGNLDLSKTLLDENDERIDFSDHEEMHTFLQELEDIHSIPFYRREHLKKAMIDIIIEKLTGKALPFEPYDIPLRNGCAYHMAILNHELGERQREYLAHALHKKGFEVYKESWINPHRLEHDEIQEDEYSFGMLRSSMALILILVNGVMADEVVIKVLRAALDNQMKVVFMYHHQSATSFDFEGIWSEAPEDLRDLLRNYECIPLQHGAHYERFTEAMIEHIVEVAELRTES